MAYKFENYGDVNPIEHGGLFIAKDEERKNSKCYMVIDISKFDDAEETWCYEECYIDLDDVTAVQTVQAYEGLDLLSRPTTDIDFVALLIQHHKCYAFGGYENSTMSGENATKEKLKEWGIII